MKKITVTAAVLAVICSINTGYGQASPSPASASSPAAAKRSEVYTVTFIHAAAGKISAMEDWAKQSGAGGPMPGHSLVLRHESESPWDYVTVQHVGPKATVEPSGNPQGRRCGH